MLARADEMVEIGVFMIDRSVELRTEASKLIGRNARAPEPLFDHFDERGGE